MQKNVAGQIWVVYAYDITDNTPKTGDAAQITANLRLDGGEANAVDDANPTELEAGYYAFDITQAESIADSLLLVPASSTENIQVVALPPHVWTRPPNFQKTLIDATGKLKLTTLAPQSITWNADGSHNVITYFNGEIWTHAYNASGQLTGVTVT
jgi:YD repeat-containing protein